MYDPVSFHMCTEALSHDEADRVMFEHFLYFGNSSSTLVLVSNDCTWFSKSDTFNKIVIYLRKVGIVLLGFDDMYFDVEIQILLIMCVHMLC